MLGLYYDPDRHAAPGYTMKKESKIKSTYIPPSEDVMFTSGKAIPYKLDEDGARVIEWGSKDHALTSQDVQVCKELGLNQDKYTIIKAMWAIAGMTAPKASDELQKRYSRGYGIRTIETYFGAINKANHSPLAVK